MANVKFHLKDKNSKKETLILLALNYNNKRFKYSTKTSVKPSNWSNKNCRVKAQASHSLEINKLLQKIEDCILETYHVLVANDSIINNKILKSRLDLKLNRKDKEDFFCYTKRYIDQKSELRDTTKRDYLQTYNTLKDFEEHTGYIVSFESINLDFYGRLQNYMIKTLKHSLSTFGKRIKTIKSIMNYATEIGVNKNLEYQKKSFKVLSKKTNRIYLTHDEINRLEKLNLFGSLEKTRDAFILMCYLGIRYSDYRKINKNNISDNYLDIIMHKTNDQVSIPIHPNAMRIIKKWEYHLPKLSNAKLNKQIKKVCRKAEIDELIVDRDMNCSKYELVTCHTARRSFATNGYLSDVPVRDLMRITGHRKETTFLSYVQVKREVKLSRILEIYPTELKRVV
ncbi:phage integrase SAM-like domain-containing protein [Flavobacteriales bacterium]|nr:phage integrase SAM-like domain-containing protein [Flavobacteriales bacterium]